MKMKDKEKTWDDEESIIRISQAPGDEQKNKKEKAKK